MSAGCDCRGGVKKGSSPLIEPPLEPAEGAVAMALAFPFGSSVVATLSRLDEEEAVSGLLSCSAGEPS